eukprot:CAMPEP_0168378236 /NCGR_PEP_ID=MMETSP0228-20121227/11235_1 /TAXON_ID=133427 /ORGANISM="Protoceratium reticulatum, Strain CCCM 535 (=CCMP 1889)" /LENGTH=305 /DNA_ID=CAMNT_0008391253 /DNA_START=67 /DNA_END=980 /DNA_ORIENTATION=+
MAMYAQYAQPGYAMPAAVQAPAELPAGTTLPGKCKTWMEDKGFGFITPDNGGPDVFVHRNQLSDGQALAAGAQVMFECRLNPNRGKYEATTCSGAAGGAAAVPGMAAMACKGFLAGKGGKGGSQDNLFIAGLPLDTTEEQIREVFGQYGLVQQCKVLPDTPGKTDRAALVRFADENQAKWMVENLNGKALLGMNAPLTVRFAGDRPEKGGIIYGKAVGKGTGLENQFTPYGAVTATAQPAATAPQLSDATLAAALMQLLPGSYPMQVDMTQTAGLAGAALAAGQPLADQAAAMAQYVAAMPGAAV